MVRCAPEIRRATYTAHTLQSVDRVQRRSTEPNRTFPRQGAARYAAHTFLRTVGRRREQRFKPIGSDAEPLARTRPRRSRGVRAAGNGPAMDTRSQRGRRHRVRGPEPSGSRCGAASSPKSISRPSTGRKSATSSTRHLRFLEQHADFLGSRFESWTVTTDGTLVADIPRHYIRILPADVHDQSPDEDPDRARLTVRNHPAGHRVDFPAKEIVDAGFLELVRYGIRSPDDPLVVASLRVVDAVLKVETPFGPCWHRYNHDGYGQRDDGGPYQGWGTGRAWPLLTGERGHYELAAGRDPAVFIRTMERFASSTGGRPRTPRPCLERSRDGRALHAGPLRRVW